MKLKAFLENLKETTLTGINLGGNNASGLTPNNYPEVIGILNDTIQRLYVEFPENKHRQVFIELRDEMYFYVLDRKYAQTNTESTEPVKYIADTPDNPFNSEVLSIISAFDEEGNPLPINEPLDPRSIFTPDFKTIQVMLPVTGNTIVIVYQGGPQPLLSEGDGYLEQEVDIPAFATYLAKLDVITHILQNRKTEHSEGEANKYFQLYQMELQKLKDKGYGMIAGTHTEKFDTNGWV